MCPVTAPIHCGLVVRYWEVSDVNRESVMADEVNDASGPITHDLNW